MAMFQEDTVVHPTHGFTGLDREKTIQHTSLYRIRRVDTMNLSLVTLRVIVCRTIFFGVNYTAR